MLLYYLNSHLNDVFVLYVRTLLVEVLVVFAINSSWQINEPCNIIANQLWHFQQAYVLCMANGIVHVNIYFNEAIQYRWGCWTLFTKLRQRSMAVAQPYAQRLGYRTDAMKGEWSMQINGRSFHNVLEMHYGREIRLTQMLIGKNI